MAAHSQCKQSQEHQHHNQGDQDGVHHIQSVGPFCDLEECEDEAGQGTFLILLFLSRVLSLLFSFFFHYYYSYYYFDNFCFAIYNKKKDIKKAFKVFLPEPLIQFSLSHETYTKYQRKTRKAIHL